MEAQRVICSSRSHEVLGADVAAFVNASARFLQQGAAQRLASAAWRVSRGRVARRHAGEPRPARIGAPSSHVSCMRSLAGAMPQENRRTDSKYATNSRRAGGQARLVAAAPTEIRLPATSGATKTCSGPRPWRNGCQHLRIRAALNGHAPRCAATSDLITMVSSTSQPAAACHRTNRRPVHRRRPGAGPREGRRPSTRRAPCLPSPDSAGQPRPQTAPLRAETACRPTLGEPAALC